MKITSTAEAKAEDKEDWDGSWEGTGLEDCTGPAMEEKDKEKEEVQMSANSSEDWTGTDVEEQQEQTQA